MSKLKIGIFTDTYYPGFDGVAISIRHLTENLRKQGHEVYLFVPKVGGIDKKEDNVFTLPSIKAWPSIPDNVRLPLPIPNKAALKALQIDFDVIHAHGNGAFCLMGLTVAKTKRIPFVMTFHTMFSEYAHYFLNGKIVKGKHLNYLFLKRWGKVCTRIIAPSNKMKDTLTSSGVKQPISVIPNFVDLSKFKSAKKGFLHDKLGLPFDTPILLSVGRLGKEKNFEFLIKFFKRYSKINAKAHLVIVGAGVDYDKLNQLIKDLRIEDRAHLTGGIPNEFMPQVYADASVFVFPSTSEVHPMVTIEAGASGLPLVVADDPAFSDVVFDGENGYLLPLKYNDFIEKVNYLLKNKKIREEFGERSKQIIKRNFQAEKITNQVVELYESAIGDYKPSRFNIRRIIDQISSFPFKDLY